MQNQLFLERIAFFNTFDARPDWVRWASLGGAARSAGAFGSGAAAGASVPAAEGPSEGACSTAVVASSAGAADSTSAGSADSLLQALNASRQIEIQEIFIAPTIASRGALATESSALLAFDGGVYISDSSQEGGARPRTDLR